MRWGGGQRIHESSNKIPRRFSWKPWAIAAWFLSIESGEDNCSNSSGIKRRKIDFEDRQGVPHWRERDCKWYGDFCLPVC